MMKHLRRDPLRMLGMTSLVVLGILSQTGPCLIAQEASDSAAQGWIDLLDDPGFAAWNKGRTAWFFAVGVAVNPENERRLVPVGSTESGSVLINGPTGRTGNLITREKFGDLEFSCEFFIPRGSNSGVKMMGIYEIQIFDSYGKDPVLAKHCGGIYPRADYLPGYTHIDQGYPPAQNACGKPGTWQTLTIRWKAPRFAEDGTKMGNAVFELVELNGQIIHKNQEVPQPTGTAWKREPKRSVGPILLQGDHGPVAFRNIRVRRLDD